MVSARCLSVWQVNIVTAISRRNVSILEIEDTGKFYFIPLHINFMSGMLIYFYLSITSKRRGLPWGKNNSSNPEAVFSRPSI